MLPMLLLHCLTCALSTSTVLLYILIFDFISTYPLFVQAHTSGNLAPFKYTCIPTDVAKYFPNFAYLMFCSTLIIIQYYHAFILRIHYITLGIFSWRPALKGF